MSEETLTRAEVTVALGYMWAELASRITEHAAIPPGFPDAPEWLSLWEQSLGAIRLEASDVVPLSTPGS